MTIRICHHLNAKSPGDLNGIVVTVPIRHDHFGRGTGLLLKIFQKFVYRCCAIPGWYDDRELHPGFLL
jgi:hypothetical protein